MIEKWIQKSHDQKTGKGKEKALPKCPFSSKQKDGIRQSTRIRNADKDGMLIKHSK